MNTPARFATVAAALGALLLFSGCFTTKTARMESPRDAYQLSVVDKSTDLEVTPQLLADLRGSVLKYLNEEGYTREGEYLVKVNLTPNLPEDAGQWVVVRVDSLPVRTYTLLAAYPGADDYYPFDFRGYYDYGYPTFARYGYYDPFDYYYGGNIAPPPAPPRHDKPGDRDNHPPTTHNRGDDRTPNSDRRPDNHRPRPEDNHPRPDNYHPRSDNPRSDDRSNWRDRGPRPESSGQSGGGSYSPPPAPSYSPPSAPASSSQSSSSPQPREERVPASTNER
jgi:hypothetical protein